jgi:hypothetical protein
MPAMYAAERASVRPNESGRLRHPKVDIISVLFIYDTEISLYYTLKEKSCKRDPTHPFCSHRGCMCTVVITITIFGQCDVFSAEEMA